MQAETTSKRTEGTIILSRIVAIVLCIICMAMAVTMGTPAPDGAGLGGWPWGWPHLTQIHLLKHLHSIKQYK